MVTPVEITAADTHDLRRRILRDGEPEAVVDWDGDSDHGTFHLGIRDDTGAIVAISTWLRQPPATQLRGMATDPAWAGRGLASGLLDAGIERCRARGDHVIWANARVTAVGFYERAGFTVVGAAFETADTGLPHREVRRRLG
jgi:GNAT superfamily N-acetyltransferase